MKRSLRVIAAAALLLMMAGSAPAQDPTSFVLIDTFPHDSGAFTQGLDFMGRKLYEGTGRYGESDLRRVVLETGKVKRKIEKNQKYFGEGVTVFKKRIYQLTWREHVTFVYALDTWRVVKKLTYEGEGWGLTHNRRHLVMSNGTSEIVFRNADDFEIKRRIKVMDGDEAVTGLNELEWVKGQILANVWPTDRIVRIDPSTGDVTGSYNMSSLRAMESEDADVTNGIAYMSGSDRLFVTGKHWAHVYEVVLRD
ncbi:MAG TPA: glutaminyl-peptide cyclotransferase [Actinomycetota bacterium]|nr:glutaminyl-peptide cyclotransferase [Actinomycetota bacterium]